MDIVININVYGEDVEIEQDITEDEYVDDEKMPSDEDLDAVEDELKLDVEEEDSGNVGGGY